MEKTWIKPPIESKASHCLCCPDTVQILPLETKLYNAFGGWSITKDWQLFFVESINKEWEECADLNHIETLIKEGDEAEYCAVLYTPLRGATYQRQEKNKWVLVEVNEGFA